LIKELKSYDAVPKFFSSELHATAVPEKVTPVPIYFHGGFDLVTSAFEGSGNVLFPCTPADVEDITTKLTDIPRVLDDANINQIKGARRERLFRNVESAILSYGHLRKINICDISDVNPNVTCRRILKTGSGISQIKDITIVLSNRNAHHRLEAPILEKLKEFNIKISLIREESIDAFLSHYVTLKHPEAWLPHVTNYPDLELIYPIGVTQEAKEMLQFQEKMSILLPWLQSYDDKRYKNFDLVISYENFVNSCDLDKFNVFVDSCLALDGCFIVTATNPSVYTDPVYAAQSGFVPLGSGTDFRGRETSVVFDNVTNQIFSDVAWSATNWVADLGANGFLVNVQHGSNIQMPFPRFRADGINNPYNDFAAIKASSPFSVYVGWRHEIQAFSKIDGSLLFGAKSKLSRNQINLDLPRPHHNKPEFMTVDDYKHIFLTREHVYFAPKMDGVNALLYVFDDAVILQYPNMECSYYTFTGKRMRDVPNFGHYAKLTPLAVLQCEYLATGGPLISEHGSERYSELVLVDVVFAMSKIGGRFNWFNVSMSCFESRLSILKRFGSYFGIPLQKYSDVPYASEEGIICQPSLAPLVIVTAKNVKIKSTSTTVKGNVIGEDIFDRINGSVPVFYATEMGDKFRKCLVEIDLCHISDVCVKMQIVGYKHSFNSSMFRVPDSPFKMSDVANIGALVAEVRDRQKKMASARKAVINCASDIAMWKSINGPKVPKCSLHGKGINSECANCLEVEDYRELVFRCYVTKAEMLRSTGLWTDVPLLYTDFLERCRGHNVGSISDCISCNAYRMFRGISEQVSDAIS
ncbi:MAG: hypothetical protein NWF06_10020, partial [Candidatus Bathyarchaeota archaeon]|nr:hypothetical protein [Candidatus Bathyarchaeum sp.]